MSATTILHADKMFKVTPTRWRDREQQFLGRRVGRESHVSTPEIAGSHHRAADPVEVEGSTVMPREIPNDSSDSNFLRTDTKSPNEN